MPEQPIPFSNQQASGQQELAGSSPAAFNVIVDDTGSVFRRPGLSAIVPALGALVSGVYCANEGDLFVVTDAVPKRIIYRVVGASATSISVAVDAGLDGYARPVFAETEALLVIAGGAEPQKIVKATKVSSRLGGSPPECSHVISIDSRLMVNNVVSNLGQLNFSDLAAGSSYAGHEVWSTGVGTAGFFNAEGRPDPVVALWDNTNEASAFGTTSLQVYGPDGQTVFAPVSARETGLTAPYSVVKSDQAYAWLDHLRRFVLSDGRNVAVISDPIQRDLDAMSTVSDCYGFRVQEGPLDAFVWTFPADGRTFAFQKQSGWSMWASRADTWGAFPVSAHYLRLDQSVNVVGTLDGQVAKLSLDNATDFGEPIDANVTTGFLNRGTDGRKLCSSVMLTLRRGTVAFDEDEPIALLSWRDTLGPWEAPIPISMGASGDDEVVVPLYSLGVYRRRQWRFEFTGTADFSLVSAVENFQSVEEQ